MDTYITTIACIIAAVAIAHALDVRKRNKELCKRHADVVTAAHKLLDEVVQHRRIHAIWAARVVQRASKGEFTQTEIEI